MKELSRRKFFLTALTPALSISGCLSGGKEPDGLFVEADLDRAELQVGGHQVYVNLYAGAEEPGVESLELQYQEPGQDHWEVLSEEENTGGEILLEESYNPGEPGMYSFRSAAEINGEKYFSEEENVEFVENRETGIF